MGSIVTSTVTGPIILSTAEIIEEECLTSKTVEDEDSQETSNGGRQNICPSL